MTNICASNGNINSVVPCTEYLTFGPWIYLVPQYKPESVLILGYAGGTVAGLIRLFYGDVPITAVDIEPAQADYDVEFIQQDAREYLKTCGHYDTIIVDLFEDGTHDPCSFVSEKWFADLLIEKGNYLIFNVNPDTDMSAYKGVHHVKTIEPFSRYRFEYYMPKTVTRLPIR